MDKLNLGPVKVYNEKSPFLAGLLSFLLPGLGQAYNGQTKKGCLFCVATGGIYLLLSFYAVIVKSFFLPHFKDAVRLNFYFLCVVIVLTIMVWIYGICDAASTADIISKKEKDPNLKTRKSILSFLFIMVGFVVFVLILMLLSAFMNKFNAIRHDQFIHI